MKQLILVLAFLAVGCGSAPVATPTASPVVAIVNGPMTAYSYGNQAAACTALKTWVPAKASISFVDSAGGTYTFENTGIFYTSVQGQVDPMIVNGTVTNNSCAITVAAGKVTGVSP